MYHLCSPHSFCVVLFVWCTVVYAHGRTYIDVSFSCLYGVPLVYARGRTYIDGALCDCMVYRMFVWCTVYVLSWSYSHRWLFIMSVCCTVSVRTHRTYIAGLYCDCVVYWLVYRLCSVLYSLWSVLSCLYGVPLVYARGRTYIDGLFLCMYGIPCMCCVFIMFVWCTVDVFCFFSSFLYLSAVTFSCNY